ncbi:MAG TPA: DDE-type integrase/transposase/recombinase [Candidatus Saccharimonadales bacterium]|nr:DDE-type integrase/transposase/recombinase [Candidatus Saccharimonadales bacterium]
MSYSSNPLLPRARAQAVRLVVEQKLPLTVAARRSGVHRTTLWRWLRRWLELNHNVQLANANRPTRVAGSKFRLSACTWLIPTTSSRPHTFGRAVPDTVVDRIRFFRRRYGRCAAIVHAYCAQEGTAVSLSTVRRVLYRLGLVVRRKWRRHYRPPAPRPHAAKPGDLVQMDTVHLTGTWQNQRRTYLYTLVDVHSRWAYAEYHTVLSQAIAADVVRRAAAYAGFPFRMVQADNGSEFGSHFEQFLQARGTQVRHSRVRRPNDNAFVERFNRTIQEECIGTANAFSEELYGKVLAYLAYYNDERLHLGLQCRTPASVLQR